MENTERLRSILSDVEESLDAAELRAIAADMADDAKNKAYLEMEEVKEAIKVKMSSFEDEPAEVVPVIEAQISLEDALRQIESLRAQIAAKGQPKLRRSKNYRLLKDDVSWSTTPQVHAVMRILRSVVEVGGVASEEEIVAAMEANVALLDTVQGGKKIFDYYKNKSFGLQAHGNIEQVF
jgi:hypothetical protein